MGTLSANKIATTYKSLVFTDHTSSGVGDIYYTSTGDADVKLTTLTTALTFTGKITATAGIELDNNIIYASDGGTTITLDTSDNVAITGDLIVTGNDIKTGTIGSPTTAITMSGANVTIAGDLTITGGNITNAITCDSTLTVAGDLTVSGDDIIIGDSDDATDKSINFRHDTCEVFMGIDDSQESNAGAFIIHTGTGFQATKLDNDFLLDGSGNLHLGNGELRTTGVAFTDGDDCLTIADGGVATFAAGVTVTGDLTFTGGARDIVFPDASGLEVKDVGGSTYIAMISDAITITPPTTITGKATLNGGVVSPIKAFSSDANGDLEIADSGKYVLISNAMSGNRTITLPAASTATGVHYHIKLTVDLTGTLDFSSDAQNELMIGNVTWLDTNADDSIADTHVGALAADAKEGIQLQAATQAGSWIDLVCDGSEWYISGVIHADAPPTYEDVS
jgi:hypothetical protein